MKNSNGKFIISLPLSLEWISYIYKKYCNILILFS